MNNFYIPGFPTPDKQDIVSFYVFKGLSYSKRIILCMALILAGFALQLLTMAAWPGIPFLFFASILNLVKGYDSRAKLDAYSIDSSWVEVDMDRIHEIKKLNDRIGKWDRDALDISNSLGAGMFVITVLGIIALSLVFIILAGDNTVGAIFITDAIILILPLWFNGIRRILKQNKLSIKIGIIMHLNEFFSRISSEGEHFKPALMLARDKTGKSIPTDARFTVSFDDMPQGFYGIQAQININDVQGSSYPYFYCVIPAKKGFGLNEFMSGINRSRRITVEFQQDKDAEVIVIRQTTTKTSGYHTELSSCTNILETAITIARNILKAQKPHQAV